VSIKIRNIFQGDVLVGLLKIIQQYVFLLLPKLGSALPLSLRDWKNKLKSTPMMGCPILHNPPDDNLITGG
jgi:hypothetical protein